MATGTRAGLATLTFSIAWPRRTVETIPQSANLVVVQVLQGANLVNFVPLQRTAGSSTVTGTMTLQAGSNLTVRADAFKETSWSPGSTAQPVASAVLQNVTLYPDEHNRVALSMVPAFTPTITRVTPTNGGPGVGVQLLGNFGTVTMNDLPQVFLGNATASLITATSGGINTSVPAGAVSASWSVVADGVASPATGSFRVLKAIALTPTATTTATGDVQLFSVPSGTDTEGATLINPTITDWFLVDPASPSSQVSSNSVGFIGQDGTFTAQGTGEVYVEVFSGTTVMASADVKVQ